MRVLFLTPTLPHPPTTGNHLRDLNFMRFLSERHDLTYVSLATAAPRRTDLEVLSRYAQVHVVQADEGHEGAPRWLLNRGRYIFGKYTHRPWQREIRSVVQSLLTEERFDLLHVATYAPWPCIAGLHRPPLVLDLCDTASLREATSARYARGVTRLKRYAEALRTRFWEMRAVADADRVVVASERDRAAIGRHPKIDVVPLGVDHDYFHRTESSPDPSTLVFVGGMGYAPNVDAVTFFVNEILPTIQAKRPEVAFWIVGRDPGPAVRALGNRPGVHVTGPVPDIRPFLERATAFVAPIRFASGVQTKVLEAMAMEMPAVVTSQAAGGLAVRHGRHVLIADQPSEFAQAVLACLEDASLRSQLSATARDFVIRHHTWDACCALLGKVYDEALSARISPIGQATETRGKDNAQNPGTLP